jgi:hypothetical protein
MVDQSVSTFQKPHGMQEIELLRPFRARYDKEEQDPYWYHFSEELTEREKIKCPYLNLEIPHPISNCCPMKVNPSS